MKVSGFTIVRNAIKYDYPVVEAISSILPVCDEMVVSVGNSEDETLTLIKSINSNKVKIVHSIWDDTLRKGGRVLAIETDKAFAQIAPESTWAFYIQADEVFHEEGIEALKGYMNQLADDTKVEGLLFNYRHFYGSYDYIADARRWYKKEVRVIKNDKSIYSFRDAQGFQKNGRPLKVKETGCYIHHYGWVKPPELQQAKQESFHKMWHNDEWMKQNIAATNKFDYSKIDSLRSFHGKHPQVMQSRINKKNWSFSFDPTKGMKPKLKHRLLDWIEKKTGWRLFGYKNYKLI